ncbi:MAG: C69 family dipeptidase [Bacilli bacterium]|jgi:dipeptidase|nr:C69 family dipeptidase [Bacilli bacterium]
MPCTTILVGKKASYNGSTIISRNDDNPTGSFAIKKYVYVDPAKQPRLYRSKIGGLSIKLPDNPLPYTCFPTVGDPKHGVWAASGINASDVSMTATETITTNPRVLGADPLLRGRKAKKGDPLYGGIGEEDIVLLVLPYVDSAKEGALRLGALLEEYGTYESNGIAFSDADSVWWLETIGGHNWIARRVKDDEVVVMPNQFGLDAFDLSDAYGAKENNLCSASLKTLIAEGHLNLSLDGSFNPRLAFGSHSDSDHVYNTPRAWFMGRYLCPRRYKWDGPAADFTPESDDIPWSFVPERKVTVEDVKYLQSSHYQGTPYDPYDKNRANPLKNVYRSIGVNRTSLLSIAEIRGGMDKARRSLMWFSFASNVYNAVVPLYFAKGIPAYFGETSAKIDANRFYWANRLIGALSDPHFVAMSNPIERYQSEMAASLRAVLSATDAKKAVSEADLAAANGKIAAIAKKATDALLGEALYLSSMKMRNGFARSDN